jgi:hypothetical protein
MAAVAPAIAYTPAMPNDKTSANACNCTYPFESPDSDTEREIIDAVSKELFIPDNYILFEISDGSGYMLGYQTSENAMTAIDISPNYEIREIWNIVTTEIPGGFKRELTSNKGEEIVILITGDPGSDSVKITVYDSSGNEIITVLGSCEDTCQPLCEDLMEYSCSAGCVLLCTLVGVVSGPGAIACALACAAACIYWGDTFVPEACEDCCDVVCDYV